MCLRLSPTPSSPSSALKTPATTSITPKSHTFIPPRPRPWPILSNQPQLSPILSLPPELRSNIYRHCLLESNDLALLQVCSQMESEAQPLLYHRPVKFASQADFFAWISTSTAADLKHVKSLTLHLTDIDLSPMLVIEYPSSRPGLTAWGMYQGEIRRVDETLSQLPNLECLTLFPPRDLHSHLLRGMYMSILAMVPRLWPDLQLLDLHDDDSVYDFVPVLRRLQNVQCAAPLHVAKSAKKQRSCEPMVKREDADSDVEWLDGVS